MSLDITMRRAIEHQLRSARSRAAAALGELEQRTGAALSEIAAGRSPSADPIAHYASEASRACGQVQALLDMLDFVDD